jgi:hypothetical protein
MTDMLDMAYINSLPQPLFVREFGSKDWWWPVYDIDVETGCYRIDVMGKLEVKHVGGAAEFRDANGNLHPVDLFFKEDPSVSERGSHD